MFMSGAIVKQMASKSAPEERNFALGLVPPFLSPFHPRRRFADTAPAVIELAESRICAN
jgi:hypothetical protein